MDKLQAAIQDLQKAPTVNIKGKQYSQVGTRVEIFRRHFPEYAIDTEVLKSDGDLVLVKASILALNDESEAVAVIATGHAEENRKNGINRTSAIENCETSAIGRALAAFGLHGGEYASADEVDTAIKQQKALDTPVKELRPLYDAVVEEIRASTPAEGQHILQTDKRVQTIRAKKSSWYDLLVEEANSLMDGANNNQDLKASPALKWKNKACEEVAKCSTKEEVDAWEELNTAKITKLQKTDNDLYLALNNFIAKHVQSLNEAA